MTTDEKPSDNAETHVLTPAELIRRRRQVYILIAIFLVFSAFLCAGSYFGWFGWVLWGMPKSQPRPAHAEGAEAQKFADRLVETETRFAREDIKKLRDILGKMNLVRGARYTKYADECRQRQKKEPEPLTSLAVANPTPQEALAASSDVLKMGILDLYRAAGLLDKRNHEVYRVFKACELARIQALPLREAYEVTDVVVPVHPAADEAVFRKRIVTTAGEDLPRLKGQLSMIQTEIKGMVAAATRMLDLAAILEPGLLGGGSTWDIASAEGQLYRIGSVFGGRRDLFQGQSGVDPTAFQHEWGRGEGPITKKELGLPIQLGLDLSKTIPLPGRKLLKSGPGAEWMFINTWYVIGPFPNPNRQNLTKKFPPEASIDPQLGFVGLDLDASYVGAGGRTLRWNFVTTDRQVCFIPPRPEEWVIWYAYSEIWSEEEQDKFCIFGSDDWGQCWIDGILVFTSGITPHPWIPDRDYAKVHFRKGFNSVLFKLENTWGRTGWSLCVFTGKVEAKPQS
jgi:hypothetical protein